MPLGGPLGLILPALGSPGFAELPLVCEREATWAYMRVTTAYPRNVGARRFKRENEREEKKCYDL